MADTSNLSQFLTDVASAIKNKKGTTDKIPAANFDTEIESIETGIDTSDATATANDMVQGKTAYVNGEKIEGSLPTYSSMDTSMREILGYTPSQLVLEEQDINDESYKTISFVDHTDENNVTAFEPDAEIKQGLLQSTVANVIGLTADKIVKGNTILGVEGTAETGGTDIGIMVVNNEDELKEAEQNAKDGDLCICLDIDKENQYIVPSKASIFNKVRIPKTLTLDFMDGHPVANKEYRLEFASFDNNSTSTATLSFYVSYNSYYKKYVFIVTFYDYNVSKSLSVYLTSDDWYGPYTFDESKSSNVKESDFVTDEFGENSYYTINSNMYLKYSGNSTDGVYWPAMINGFTFTGLYQYNTIPTNKIKTFTHDVTLTGQMDDMMMGITYTIDVTNYIPLDLDNWKSKLSNGLDKIQAIINNGYGTFSYDMVHTVETTHNKTQIISTRIYVYPTSGYETASATLLYTSTEQVTPFSLIYTKRDGWNTVYYIDIPFRGSIGDVQTLDFSDVTANDYINIPIDSGKYFGVQCRNDHRMYMNGVFEKMSIKYDNNAMYVSYKSDYQPYLYDTGYHPLNTNLSLTDDSQIFPDLTAYGNNGLVYGDGTIFDLSIDTLLQRIFKTDGKCISMYTKLPITGGDNLTGNIVPVKITKNVTKTMIMKNYINSTMKFGKSSVLLRADNKLYSSTISNGISIYYGVRLAWLQSKKTGILTDLDTNTSYNICDFAMPTKYGILTSQYTDSSIPNNYPICLIGNDGTITSVTMNTSLVSGYTIYRRLYLKDDMLFVFIGNGKYNASVNKYKIIVYKIGENSITKVTESDTYELTASNIRYSFASGMAFDKDTGKMYIGCGFDPVYDIFSYTDGIFTLEHHNVANCPYAVTYSSGGLIGMLDTVQDKIMCLVAGQNGTLDCISTDYNTSYNVTYKGINSSNFFDIFPGNKMYILTNSVKVAATYSFDYDTNTITFTPTNEEGNAIPYCDSYYYNTLYITNTNEEVLLQFAYEPDDVMYDSITKQTKQYMTAGWTISDTDGMTAIYLEPCEWSDIDLCGVLVKTNGIQSPYTILSLNSNAETILEQYRINNGLSTGPITQSEYDTALETATNILGITTPEQIMSDILKNYPTAMEMDTSKIKQEVTSVDVQLVKSISNTTGSIQGNGFTVGIIIPKEDIKPETSTIRFDISDTGEDGTYSSWSLLSQALNDVYQTTGILSDMPDDYTIHGSEMDIEMGMGYYYPDVLRAGNAYPVVLCAYKAANYVRMYEE